MCDHIARQSFSSLHFSLLPFIDYVLTYYVLDPLLPTPSVIMAFTTALSTKRGTNKDIEKESLSSLEKKVLDVAVVILLCR